MNGLQPLMRCLCRLPGVGRRSAERMALRLVRDRTGLLRELIETLRTTAENVRCCSLCGNVTAADEDPCRLCADPARDGRLLCVVEEPGDIALIESSGGWRGRYHALMGKISPVRGDGPADLRIRTLLARIRREGFEEIVLALSTDGAGEATAGFLAELLKNEPVKTTRLARGIPAGSAVMYADPATLARAMQGRYSA